MARKQRYDNDKPKSTYIKSLTALNEAQKHYLALLHENTVTFCAGPAGTGKTFLAAHQALSALLNGEVNKIILTRPIVATEDIGFLPGDMNEKIHPYMLPLFDALEEHLGPTKAKEMIADGVIQVLPLAYMRGRSLNNAFIILDEAQNTTPEQMKMFLTRLGRDSKMAVNGDGSQTDLQIPVNGLTWAMARLRGASSEIALMEFGSQNIVRNPLIETMLSRLNTSPPREHEYSRHDFTTPASLAKDRVARLA